MARVALSHLSKTFADGTRALVDLDLAVDDGEFLVLVGPSGCGKSTALRLLAGLEQPDAGEILLDGEVVTALSPQQRNIAMVFQNYALYPHMSVRANLAFPLRMRRLARVEIARRVQAAAELLELGALLERRPQELSGGQRQRVAMGRAIVREPRVFLMDEPLSNLDARLRVQIRTDIANLQCRLGTTTLYVTHDQVEAMTLGRRVAVLNAGRLQQVDEPQLLYRRPANTFVAGFIGSPGMNTLPARLDPGKDGPVVRWGEAVLALRGGAPVPGASLGDHLGRAVLLGLRPDALRVTVPGAAHLRARVQAVEALGHEQLVYLEDPDGDGEVLIARLDARTPVAAGDTLPLCVDEERLYLFAPGGEAIHWGG
jgi:ABC-type sugar transport system ATPase subunit